MRQFADLNEVFEREREKERRMEGTKERKNENNNNNKICSGIIVAKVSDSARPCHLCFIHRISMSTSRLRKEQNSIKAYPNDVRSSEEKNK
jgi:hypothetical protein